MKKRSILAGIIAVVSLLLFSSLLKAFGTPKYMNNLFISDSEFNDIIASRELDEELDLSSLKINNFAPYFAGNQIYYSTIENNKHALNPAISIESSLNIAFKGEHLSEDSIKKNTSIDVLVYSEDKYYQLSMTTTTLPLLSLDFENGKMPENRSDDDFKMTLFDNRENVRDRIITSDGEAHKRGGASYYAEKANLSMELTYESTGHHTRDNKISLLGMQERNKYVLQGMYYDQEKARDYFGSELWREMSDKRNEFNLELSYEWRYVEVIVNGDYYGLYMLGYKPDETVFQVNTEGDHPDILFKAAEGQDFSDFIMGKSTTIPNYELVSDTNIISSYNILREYMRAMYGSDLQKALEWTDYNNAIDYWLFTNITQNIDIPRIYGMVKNSYLCFKWDGEKYKAEFIPWDHDIAMGSNSLYGDFYTMDPGANVILSTDLVAISQRTEDNEISSVISAYYADLRTSTLSIAKINSLIDEQESLIFDSGAFARNMSRWPNSNHIDPSQRLSLFRDYINARLAYLDNNLFNTDNQLNPVYTIPNYLNVYLESGEILSKDDPEYYEPLPEEDEEILYDPYLYSSGF